MAATALIDHSPHHPAPAAPLANASNLILIDNYDSFTWNVYQYLVLEGASVTVYRNDEITLKDLIALNPTQLVVSPGPGHPDNDAGISTSAIEYFGGKIPVLGVCMGEQCIFAAFGGRVDVTGEILHGKTSPLTHDGKGVYAGLPQDLPVTRYHSLAGTHASLPECLEVSSWISGGPDGGKGIIMGVRHKDLLVEGVQFHPESILTAEGRIMLKNFLRMRGGTWTENAKFQKEDATDSKNTSEVNGASQGNSKESILEKIYRHRKQSIAAQKEIPSQRPSDFQKLYDIDVAPPLVSFRERLRKSPYSLSLLAEIKRASPSKGPIAMSICAPVQARKYAMAGASVISVLTEPEWFKGSLDDLKAVRQSLEGMPNRPAVLRKEFIFDKYQILEARLAGADTVLLIVKMLEKPLLEWLYKYSQELGMEPLVEVNTLEEMEIAVALGAQVIGVNNRDLTNFEVDLDTTSRLMNGVPKDTIVCALSGISGPKDVRAYQSHGVGGVLVGEALMKAANVTTFVSELLGGTDSKSLDNSKHPMLVKICGTRSPEAAKAAVEAGADLIGMILVEGRKRCVPTSTALAISRVVHQTSNSSMPDSKIDTMLQSSKATDFFDHSTSSFARKSRALLVGVFQNQPLSYVLEQQRLLNLDIVQLHGSEPLEWAKLIPVPVLRRFGPNDAGLATRGYHSMPLIDTVAGGTGQKVDIMSVTKRLGLDPGLRVILAGGLTPDNVESVIKAAQTRQGSVIGVDVSSGVEEDGIQSLDLIKSFIGRVKGQ